MPTKKILLAVCSILFVLLPLFIFVQEASSDELDDITKQLNELNDALNKSVTATKPLQSELTRMQQQITGIKNRVVYLEGEMTQKKKEIDKGYKELSEKRELIALAIRQHYIKSFSDSPLLIFLSTSASEATQALAYQKARTNQDKQIITNAALSIIELESKKIELEQEQKWLIATKANLDTQSAKLDKVVGEAKTYQANLSSQISSLSAKQQSLLAAKLGSLNIPLYAYNTSNGCSSDINPYKDPGFDGPKFALFSYGVPNRVGMNQYGAWGRAKAGQGEDDILRAYYNFDGYDTSYSGIQIRVNDSNGFNSGNFIWSGNLEDYLKRLYEVPDSWTDNNLAVLKAQAIAARSYVLAQTDNGNKSICANEYCQVFKTDPKGGNWDIAVSQTPGKAMIQGGKPITAYFSSTHGGYVYTTSDIGWNGTSFTKRNVDANGSISSFSDLNNKAYDKDSPWFYCDWGGRKQYNNTAWMTSSEMADIVNSILLVQHDSSTDPHILQTDKSDPATWSEDKVKQELNKYRTPFSSISSSSVDADFGSGRSTTIHFSGSAGSVNFEANVFKKYFNLRAPANINIVGPLYNIEIR